MQLSIHSPLRYLIAHTELDAGTDTSIRIQKSQDLVVFPLDRFLQLLAPYRQIVKQALDYDGCALLRRHHRHALKLPQLLELELCAFRPIRGPSRNDVELRESA
jgi:hypothetical protein